MQLIRPLTWKIFWNILFILFFAVMVYTLLSYTYLSYFIFGNVLRRPLESKSEYLIRSLIFLSHEHKHTPKSYSDYKDELAGLEWDDVKKDLIRTYLETPINVRCNYRPIQMFFLWSKEAKAECEKLMMNHEIYGKKEYLKLLYLHFYICNYTSFKEEAFETCKKIRNIFKEEKFSKDSDIDHIKLIISGYCPDC